MAKELMDYSEYEKLQSEHRILLEERKITMSQL